ncbi:ketoacyl-ACP synthase III [uncultured Maribacter sp.]|uniref:3-oxoacyl-ACP synthase III family protein n=1 Tax=uncultured Maribacter sp. TaxID=431308 RepID=UPI00262F196A|nr:ketoacyl-ACP synthase III [uncultured Maribacter sp.]
MPIGITGTGSYLPTEITKNEDFESHTFLNSDGSNINAPNPVIIKKFKAITGIQERRYASKDLNTSDLAYFASEKAIEDAGIDKETLDYIIVAHNFGDVIYGNIQGDTLPSLATRVKHKLGIKNPRCVAYDILFGCPGWVQAMIQAHAFIKSGIATKCLVIGAETLSRIVDKYDRDSMIYSDGAGATIVENSTNAGEILFHDSATYANGEANYLFFGKTYNTKIEDDNLYIKMFGRKIYEFALTHVPVAMKHCLDSAKIPIKDLKKIFIHQANEKMDEAIVQRFYKLYEIDQTPKGVMPMIIEKLGNSSVATIPTLLDLVNKNEVENQKLNKGDVILFASVGAGMNVNAIVYRV